MNKGNNKLKGKNCFKRKKRKDNSTIGVQIASLDLVSLDSFFFTNLKKWLSGRKFVNNEKVEFAVLTIPYIIENIFPKLLYFLY